MIFRIEIWPKEEKFEGGQPPPPPPPLSGEKFPTPWLTLQPPDWKCQNPPLIERLLEDFMDFNDMRTYVY